MMHLADRAELVDLPVDVAPRLLGAQLSLESDHDSKLRAGGVTQSWWRDSEGEVFNSWFFLVHKGFLGSGFVGGVV